jgi:hypothetical protein
MAPVAQVPDHVLDGERAGQSQRKRRRLAALVNDGVDGDGGFTSEGHNEVNSR